MTRKHKIHSSLYRLLNVMILAIVIGATSLASAQNETGPWSPAVNLSQSGGTSNPFVVADASGGVHVLWLDAYAGAVYTQRTSADQWTRPATVDFPFQESITSLRLIPDRGGNIHALWVEEPGVWLYSRVPGDNFGSAYAWIPGQRLTLSAPAADLAVDGDGNAHLAFIHSDQTIDYPAGVYYSSSQDGYNWTAPTPLYISPYLRGLTQEGGRVGLTVVGNEAVYVGWDDPHQERVWLARSEDGGDSWSEPFVIDRRRERDALQGQGPSGVLLAAQGGEALLLWAAGHEGAGCRFYSQYPAGSGSIQPMPERLGCPDDLQLVENQEGELWLFAKTEGSASLIIWDTDEGRWSTPRVQTGLSHFTHPGTYRRMELGCQQAALNGEELIVVGCDKGSSGDIWITRRELGSKLEWFPTPTPTSQWSTPAVLSHGDEDASQKAEISAPGLAFDQKGRLHAFWTQSGSASLYASLWDGTRWSQPEEILVSPGGSPRDPYAAMSPRGQLLLTWSDASSGQLYLSWADAQTPSSDAWSVPQEIPTSSLSASRSPKISVEAMGKLHMAYSIPFNEGRGIYILDSNGAFQEDGSLTWSQPERVFDAAGAGWQSLGEPQLALDDEGGSHLLWTRYSLPPDAQPRGLYYARSEGSVWSEAVEVDVGNISWSQLVSGGDILHRAWGKESGGRVSVWHQFSPDGGKTWSQAARATGIGGEDGPASFSVDAAGNLHLIQITQNGFVPAEGSAPLALQAWTWERDSQEWISTSMLPLEGLAQAENLILLGAPDGMLGALFRGHFFDPDSGEPGLSGLFFSARELELAAATPVPLPTFTPGPAELSSVETTPEPSPTPPLVFSTQSPGRMSSLMGSRWAGMVIGAVPALLVVIAAFTFGARKLRERR